MKGGDANVKKLMTILMMLFLSFILIGLVCGLGWAGEKEELQYQNSGLRIQNLSLQLQIVVKERDQIIEQMKKQGYTFDQNGNFTRPKAEEPKKK